MRFKRIFLINIVVLFGALCILQIHNALSYPVRRGFDAADHLFYVHVIKTQHRLPLANEGGETDHPPLYYALASLAPSTDSIKVLGILSWLALSIISFTAFKKLFRDTIPAGAGALIVASLPAVIYTTPQVSNELFSAAVMSGALCYYAVNRHDLRRKSAVITGLLLGLSLLSKVTAVALAIAIVVDLLAHRPNKKTFVSTLFVAVPAILVSGAFYLRNLVVFHNPFVITTDFPNQIIHQPPGYRDLKFFTDLSGFVRMDLFHAHYYSLFAGTYFSWFYDGQNAVVPVQAFSKIGAVLVILSLPLAMLLLIGFMREIRNRTHLVLILYPVILFGFYVMFTVKLPYYSSVKGIYLLSAVAPFAYFVARNLKGVNTGKLLVFLVYVNLYCAVIVKNFWLR